MPVGLASTMVSCADTASSVQLESLCFYGEPAGNLAYGARKRRRLCSCRSKLRLCCFNIFLAFCSDQMLYRRVMFHQQLKPFRNATPTHSVNFLCLLMLVLLTAAPTQQYADDPEILGETFSSCVEVIEVWPEPYSFLKPSAIDSQFVSYEFRLKFSRPIFISHRDSTVEKSHPDPHGNFMVFLSPSSYKFIPHKAHHLGYWQSSRRVIMAKFRLQRGHLEAMAR